MCENLPARVQHPVNIRHWPLAADCVVTQDWLMGLLPQMLGRRVRPQGWQLQLSGDRSPRQGACLWFPDVSKLLLVSLDSVEGQARTLQRPTLTPSPHLMGRWLYWSEGGVRPSGLGCLGSWTVCVAFQRAILKTAAQNKYFGCFLRCGRGGDFHGVWFASRFSWVVYSLRSPRPVPGKHVPRSWAAGTALPRERLNWLALPGGPIAMMQ